MRKISSQVIHKGLYATGFCASMLSDKFYTFAFSVMAFGLTGKAATGALVYAVGYGSEILASLCLGGILDACPKRVVFSWAMGLKMALFLAIFGWFSQEGIGLLGLSVAAFWVDLLGHALHLTNVVALAKFYVGEERIQFEGFMLTLSSVVQIGGPVLAGIFHGFLPTPNHLLLVAMGCQLLAVGAYRLVMRRMESGPTQAASEQPFRYLLFETIHTLRSAWKQAIWRKILLLNGLTVVSMALATLLLFPLLAKTHQLPTAKVGTLMGIGAAGSILLGMLIQRYLRPNHLRMATPYAAALVGCTTLALAFCRGFYRAAIFIFLFEASVTCFFRLERLYLQSLIPPERMGRLWAALDAVERCFCLVGILLGGCLFDALGGRWLYGLLALALLAMACFWRAFGRAAEAMVPPAAEPHRRPS